MNFDHPHAHAHGSISIPADPLEFTHLMSLADRSDVPENLRNLRRIGLQAFITGLNAVLPKNLIANKVLLTETDLIIDREVIPRSSFSQIIIVGGGKATAQLCQCLVDALGDSIPMKGSINIPYHQTDSRSIRSPLGKSEVKIVFSGHPIPDENGVKGVEAMFDLITTSPADALVLALISGGGSALMPAPADGITLAEKQQVNKLLLDCGANIHEINCVRKHLSKFKGGQLSAFAAPRRVYSLIISDVVGNDIQTIASGPTVPDLTSFDKVKEICTRYRIWDRLPESVRTRIDRGIKGEIPETPKPNPTIFDHTTNIIIGSAEHSAEVARMVLQNQNIWAEIYSDTLQGEAKEYGAKLAEMLPNFDLTNLPAVYIGTGEFTVTIRGKGKGGRNQEMLLGFLDALEQNSSLKAHHMTFVIISGAFDGIEGNSGAMGAIIDSTSLSRAATLGLSIQDFLSQNNSYAFFDRLGDILRSGQTGTNVNDMTMILINS
jgi:glycerate-2-kinase